MKVTVLDREAQKQAWGHGGGGAVLVTVEIADLCPVCLAPRGKPQSVAQCEEGEWLAVDRWENPCGHADTYAAVVMESRLIAAFVGDHCRSGEPSWPPG